MHGFPFLLPSSFSFLLFLLCRHRRTDSPAHRKIPYDGHASGTAGGHEVVEDLVGDRLVEDAPVAESNHVVLEGLELEAALVGDVRDPDLAEVGEAGLGAHGGE